MQVTSLNSFNKKLLSQSVLVATLLMEELPCKQQLSIRTPQVKDLSPEQYGCHYQSTSKVIGNMQCLYVTQSKSDGESTMSITCVFTMVGFLSMTGEGKAFDSFQPKRILQKLQM